MASNTEKQLEIDSPLFYQKIGRIYQEWEVPLYPYPSKAQPEMKNVKGIMVVLGKCPNLEHQRSFSEVFHLWLIEYLFTETVILLTKSKVVFLTTQKKKRYIDKIQQPAQYQGPKVATIERPTKGTDPGKYEELLKELPGIDSEPVTVATFTQDTLHGAFPEEFLGFIKGKANVNLVDASGFFEKVISVKTSSEQEIIRKGGKALVYMFTRTISLLERIIDEEAMMTHQQISEQIMQFTTDPDAIKHYQDNAVDKDMIEVPRDPLVQSGGIYSIVPIKPNTSEISADVVLISNWIKYRNYQCSASRTLLIDASDEQKKTYKTLLGCFQQCTSLLTAGIPIKDVYNKGIQYIKDNDPSLLQYLSKSFGCGVGCKEEEKSLEITADNNTVIMPGMVFELRVGLEGISDKKMQYAILLADTIMIGGEGKPREILTGAISKAFKDISYSMTAEVEEPPAKPMEEKKKISSDVVRAGTEALNQSWGNERRLRTKDKPQNLEREAKRKQHQKELLSQKMEELQERLSSNKVETAKKVSELRNLTDISSYDSPAQIPSEAKSSGIYIDSKKETLLVPIGGRMIPFHVSTIKNVSKTEESGGHSFLRVNFHVPGDGATFTGPIGFPEAKGDNFAFLKEITIRISDSKSVSNAHRIIKELIKRVKVRDQEKKEKEGLVSQKALIPLKGKKPSLNDVSVRPNISGKKTSGTLEGHSNGLRFTSTKGEKIDIIYENIKHAFYQPCENELIVLVHFHLHNPILVGNKKAKDIQFYSEVGLVADDLDMRRRNLQDMDELEQENRERQLRAKLNNEFKRFADQIEQLSRIEFDIPYRELGFFGVPQKSNVLLVPTVNCLVNLTEVPFFVVSLADIEVVHFERVNFSLRNFDMVLIFKDLTNYVRISCIPAESLEMIKDWLNEVNIVYSEGTVNLNWTNLLTEIRADPEGFLEQKGWGFLQEDSESEEEEDAKEMEEDSEFEPEEEEEASEYSVEGDESEEYAEEEESELDAEEELEEEGLEWDELEEKAAREDKKHEKRFGKEEVAPKSKKRTKRD